MKIFILIQSFFIYALLTGSVFFCQCVIFSVLQTLNTLQSKSPLMVNPFLSMCTVHPQLYQTNIAPL